MKNKLNSFICSIIGHSNKYRYQVETHDNKILEVTTCSRCWKETKKEVSK